ncbi:peptidoglycan D,D-transpeptidase FtsI family protein [Ornithinimicrobium pekingense]|uniref:Cell division protein n=1 Tax=Ornithinimicrobium pekingense TaxID=384677 RepID=A0ABQ2FAG3_9MICO|nr:penicillin-binding protein 2 [Ornithinimicrobium pekingense]GGK68586.1 cell division protein [Ornithinimicrobium pekingense]
MRTMLVGVMVVLSLFAAQLVRLQGLDAASVSAAAVNGRLEVRAIPAERGTITDVSGAELAVSVERRRIVADPTLVEDYTLKDDEGEVVAEGFAAAAQVVSEVTGADEGPILEALTDPPGEKYTVLVKDVSPQTWQELRARGVRGVSAENVMRRDYPLGEAAAPLVGWMGAGEMPAGGIELVHHDDLTGAPGEAVFEVGSSGERISTGLYQEDPAVPGQDVRLSIDADLQWYAYDAIRERVKDAGALRGYAVVQEVSTGRIVALASYPGFDPADDTQTSEDMRNAAIEDVYEPGSTAKLITAAAAVEEGLVERDTPVEVPVSLPRGGTSFRDVEPHPVQHLTFAGVIAKSSNMGTILVGEKLGEQKLYDWIRKFGLGSPVGHGLPGESAGLVPQPGTAGWSDTTQYTLMFGQGYSGSFLQQVSVFQTIANDGTRLTPSFIQGTVDEEGRYAELPLPTGTRVVSKETADTLTEIMQQIPATGGTAPLAAVDGYHVAGKTSTADRFDETKGGYSGVTSSFIGFAPADDPKYVVGVAVQRPTKIHRFGGIIAGPVFSSVMRYALQKEGVEPAEGPPLEVPLEYDPAKKAPGQGSGVTLGDIAIKDEGRR